MGGILDIQEAYDNNETILTKTGFEKLKDELDHLVSVKRKEVAARLKEAKSFGDLSENSEYEDAKNEQAFVEGRIREIKHVMMHAHIVDTKQAKTDSVTVGLTATLKDLETGKSHDFKLVGSYEADPDLLQISHESPVGKAIMDKKVGDIVVIELPHGALRYKVEKISK
jgi:transcription elongation factor GreA